MLHPSQLHDYQKKAIVTQIEQPYSMIWVDMGLGKTIISLTTVEHRIREGKVKKVLIFGPLRVIYTVWENEAKKWTHTKHLRFQIIRGDAKAKQKQITANADVYLTNYENMIWLSNHLIETYPDKDFPFEMVVYDEVTKLKSHSTKRLNGGRKEVMTLKGPKRIRFYGWKHVSSRFKYRTGLTGTPAPNGYPDLFGQYINVDGGKALGLTVTQFRNQYLAPNYNRFGYKVTEDGVQRIEERIKDITIQMSAKDHLQLPDLILNDVMIPFSNSIRKQYDELMAKFIVELNSDSKIEVFNKASLSNKLLQFCNGSPYLEAGKPEWYDLHNLKLKALDSILEEAAGNIILCSYIFKSDCQRIMSKFKSYSPVNLSNTPLKNLQNVLDDIAKGKHKLIVGHPSSIGHGIDGLQDVCNIGVMYGLSWNFEFYTQLIARLRRQGQKKNVIIHRLMMENSMDEIVRDSLLCKEGEQSNLKTAIFNHQRRKENNFW